MTGKIVFKLNHKTYLKSNSYEIFIDNNFVGKIDYKNRKLDFCTNVGNHRILVKGKNHKKELSYTITSRKRIVPIDINENFLWQRNSKRFPKIINAIILGFLFFFALLISFLILTNYINFSYLLLSPFILVLLIAFNSKNQNQFTLNIR
jgi:hypothetical protein